MEVPIAVNSSIKNKDELEAEDEVKPGDNTILNTIIDSRYGWNSTRQADPSEKRTQNRSWSRSRSETSRWVNHQQDRGDQIQMKNDRAGQKRRLG